MLNGGLGGNAGAGAALVEHDGDGLAIKSTLEALWHYTGLDGVLVAFGIADKLNKLSWSEVGNREKMARVVWIWWERNGTGMD